MAWRPGTDIVSVERIAKLIDERGSLFLQRWFTDEEIAYCSHKVQPALHFAARLAAKEAVVKALRLPRDGPIPWRNIEISNDLLGAPFVRLYGQVLESASRDQVRKVDVSLSHCRDYATATAIVEVADLPPGVPLPGLR